MNTSFNFVTFMLKKKKKNSFTLVKNWDVFPYNSFTLHKKWSFPLRISSVNVTKSLMEKFIFWAILLLEAIQKQKYNRTLTTLTYMLIINLDYTSVIFYNFFLAYIFIKLLATDFWKIIFTKYHHHLNKQRFASQS